MYILPDQGSNLCPCIGRQTPIDCATREALALQIINSPPVFCALAVAMLSTNPELSKTVFFLSRILCHCMHRIE